MSFAHPVESSLVTMMRPADSQKSGHASTKRGGSGGSKLALRGQASASRHPPGGTRSDNWNAREFGCRNSGSHEPGAQEIDSAFLSATSPRTPSSAASRSAPG